MPIITIDVTREDIDEGMTSSCNRCPIALAARRAVGSDLIGVTGSYLWVESQAIRLPEAVREFIHGFDDGTTLRFLIKPFSFDLDVPAESIPHTTQIGA